MRAYPQYPQRAKPARRRNACGLRLFLTEPYLLPARLAFAASHSAALTMAGIVPSGSGTHSDCGRSTFLCPPVFAFTACHRYAHASPLYAGLMMTLRTVVVFHPSFPPFGVGMPSTFNREAT